MRQAICDQCHEVIIDRSVPFAVRTEQPKGAGWISSGGDDFDFCSWRCVQRFAKAQRKGTPPEPAQPFPFGERLAALGYDGSVR